MALASAKPSDHCCRQAERLIFSSLSSATLCCKPVMGIIMKRLLYISTARTPLSAAELDDVLARSRRNNAASDVTGLLVVGGRRFLQALEGPEASVDATFDRIKRDRRHFAIVKLHDKLVTERSFDQWAMGFERGADSGDGAALEDQIAAIIAPIADANLRAYFTGFARSHSTA